MSALAHVIESITPASRAQAEAARRRVAPAGVPMLERLAAALAGAQHAPRPRTRRMVVVCAGDHPAADPGIRLGAAHPTIVAAQAIAGGTAALCGVARVAGAPIVLVDAGVAEPAELPAAAIPLRDAGLHALGATLARAEAERGLEAGIALAVSLETDVIAVGAIGITDDVALAGDAYAMLAAAGRPTAVLAGLMLSAASMNIPVILDGRATAAAAVVAAALAPDVTGYLIAAHAGPGALLARLGLPPVFELGLGHGEGTGAAMVLPLIDQVAALGTTGP